MILNGRQHTRLRLLTRTVAPCIKQSGGQRIGLQVSLQPAEIREIRRRRRWFWIFDRPGHGVLFSRQEAEREQP
ncbi:hypothetical protein QU41_03025 [Bradyrhizobium elkanii]|nr:hypothetical protein QU41_03025 [Bradyrhizobium elkanii]